ncbi:MAG: SH3 domain-containing protein [Chloroflexi bacterium]|nr:SH3 domain-containing protein [Chloroflexota bacterium]
MRGFIRAAARLVLMVLVMAGVILTATAVGLPTAAVLGLSITIAGLVGMIRLSRRETPRGSNAAAAVAAMRVGAPLASSAASPATAPDVDADPVMASMAPDQDVDPEALMPRWRRPSLLAARRADPLRVARTDRLPLRFPAGNDSSGARRLVRYAVVALLDRPDEVLGRQLEDLMSGDEVEVLENGGAFWRVMCPNGRIGWVHRTTLGAVGAEALTFGHRVEVPEQDDLLSAVLSARGIH